jgi:hypothetical protein
MTEKNTQTLFERDNFVPKIVYPVVIVNDNTENNFKIVEQYKYIEPKTKMDRLIMNKLKTHQNK